MNGPESEAGPPGEASNNGHHVDQDEEMIAMLRKAIGVRKARIAELQQAMDDITPDLRRYERALALLTGATSPVGRPARQSPAKALKARGKTVSDQKVERVEAAVRRYAEDHDEFRQVDIRGVNEGLTSSVTAVVFDVLRQRNVIRLARVDGNNKYYRLTRAEVTEPAS
jgi:hypothetical protein